MEQREDEENSTGKGSILLYKQKTEYELRLSLVGSEKYIRDRLWGVQKCAYLMKCRTAILRHGFRAACETLHLRGVAS